MFNLIGSGMNYGGQVVQQIGTEMGLPSDTITTIQDVSAQAFMQGMDRAVIFSGIGIIAAGILSWFLIDDEVVAKPVDELRNEAIEGEALAGPAA